MKFRKIISIILTSLFCGINFCHTEVKALFGNAHFGVGEKIAQKLNLSESKRIALLSGMVYADIGRFKFDKKTGIDSDSDKFASAMEDLAETDDEKWFVCGFKIHIFQDKNTRKFLKEILNREYHSYIDYVADCGVLESYFSKKLGILYNEFLDKFNFEQVTENLNMDDLSKTFNIPKEKIKDFILLILKNYSDYPQKNNLLLYGNLIAKTYKSLGFEITIDEINEQAGNLLSVFIIISSIVESRIEISEKMASKIEDSSNELAKLCVEIVNA